MNKSATVIVLGLFIVLIGLNWSRFARDMGAPALLREPTGVWVRLGHGFPEVGMSRQLNDGCQLDSVIKLTNLSFSSVLIDSQLDQTPIESGRRIDLVVQGSEIQSVSFSWMSASQRIVLNIPLHPDRMSQKDWEILPGIGPKMAARIEENRQNIGDFGSFSALRRIKGVGARKMEVWREFF